MFVYMYAAFAVVIVIFLATREVLPNNSHVVSVYKCICSRINTIQWNLLSKYVPGLVHTYSWIVTIISFYFSLFLCMVLLYSLLFICFVLFCFVLFIVTVLFCCRVPRIVAIG